MTRRALLILGDCAEVLPRLPAGSIDVVDCDPPYFTPAVHYSSRVEWGRAWSDTSILSTWWGVIAAELRRVVKPSGHVLVFSHHESFAAFYPPMYSHFETMVSLVWDKGRPGLGQTWRHQHELIIAGRARGAYKAKGKLFPDVLRHTATLTRHRRHPVEKPVSLHVELLEASCPPGGKVCDPYMGSGTTGIAALRTGRTFVGIEKEPHYFWDTVRVFRDEFGEEAVGVIAPGASTTRRDTSEAPEDGRGLARAS